MLCFPEKPAHNPLALCKLARSQQQSTCLASILGNIEEGSATGPQSLIRSVPAAPPRQWVAEIQNRPHLFMSLSFIHSPLVYSLNLLIRFFLPCNLSTILLFFEVVVSVAIVVTLLILKLAFLKTRVWPHASVSP